MVGYETRSGFAVEKVQARKTMAVVADQHRQLSFAENLAKAEARKSALVSEGRLDEEFLSKLDEGLGGDNSSDRSGMPPVVALDVSSLSRKIMSFVLRHLHERANAGAIDLRLIYVEGGFQPPPQVSPPYLDLAPIDGLEGWSLYPERPLSVVVGVGYEPDLASAAIEYLDPSGTWVFVAEGRDKRYREAAMAANASLLHVVDAERILDYGPERPHRLFAQLLSLVETLANRSRVVVVTGGPKVFWAIAMLVKLQVGDEVAVWRVSSHDHADVRDTIPAGHFVEFNYVPPRS